MPLCVMLQWLSFKKLHSLMPIRNEVSNIDSGKPQYLAIWATEVPLETLFIRSLQYRFSNQPSRKTYSLECIVGFGISGEACYCRKVCLSCKKSLAWIGTQTVRRLSSLETIRLHRWMQESMWTHLKSFRSLWEEKWNIFNAIEI